MRLNFTTDVRIYTKEVEKLLLGSQGLLILTFTHVFTVSLLYTKVKIFLYSLTDRNCRCPNALVN